MSHRSGCCVVSPVGILLPLVLICALLSSRESTRCEGFSTNHNAFVPSAPAPAAAAFVRRRRSSTARVELPVGRSRRAGRQASKPRPDDNDDVRRGGGGDDRIPRGSDDGSGSGRGATEEEEGEQQQQQEEEWRSFRARLVRSASSGGATPAASSDGDEDGGGGGGWAYDAGSNVEVGTVLLSVPTPDLCQGLEQQWFHRCVCIVTHRASSAGMDDSFAGGVEREGGEDDAECYAARAVLLNRPAKLPVVPPNRKEGVSAGDDGWTAWFGGDIGGPLAAIDVDGGGEDGAETASGGDEEIDGLGMEILCLHSLSSPEAAAASSLLLPGPPDGVGLYTISIDEAARLVTEGVADRDDFYCFAGHCAWNPGQLEREMGPLRGEWIALSADGGTIAEELGRQRERAEEEADRGSDGGGNDAGSTMWTSLAGRAGRPDAATAGVSEGQLRFYDGMLRAWTREILLDPPPPLGAEEENLERDEEVPPIDSAIVEIGPGALLRAALPTSTHAPFLVEEQEFHCSLVLVLSDDDEYTVGAILNLPLAGVVELAEGVELPIRYGGPGDIYDLEGEDEKWDARESGESDAWDEESFIIGAEAKRVMENIQEDESVGEGKVGQEGASSVQATARWDMAPDDPFLYLHRSPALLWKGIGTPLDHRSGVCTLSEIDAGRALRTGLAKPEDLLLVSGFCLWAKGDELGVVGGGVAEQIAMGNFELVESDKLGKLWEKVWETLSRQEVLRSESLSKNVERAVAAWEEASAESIEDGKGSELVQLADAALKAWVAVSMLGDPTQPVEIPPR